jgi:hypothetical protein
METYRFSEDLDFTVLPHGPYLPDDIVAHLQRTIAHVSDASGINFAAREPVLRLHPDGLSVEGRVYYIGPRQQLQPARVKLDITANERLVRPPVLRDIGHPYPDALIGSSQVRCLLVRGALRGEAAGHGTTRQTARRVGRRQPIPSQRSSSVSRCDFALRWSTSAR